MTTYYRIKNVHFQGSDRKRNETVINSDIQISSAEINVAASCGYSKIKVYKLPRIAVVSTGDELVDIAASPLPHQIRRSNSHMIQSALKDRGMRSNTYHIADNLDHLNNEIDRLVQQYDIIILSGGVSAGKFDFVPKALSNAGVKNIFHKVKQRPGKPLWFGASESGPVVFGLPGNPVSTFVCLQKYVIPWICECLKVSTPPESAILSEDIAFSKPLTYFAQVKLDCVQGSIIASPSLGHGSGDLANLSNADAFMELPMAKERFTKGEAYPIFRYR